MDSQQAESSVGLSGGVRLSDSTAIGAEPRGASASRLKVVHICAPASVGGLEKVVQDLSRGLAASGHEVTVVTVVAPGVDNRPMTVPMTAAGVEVVELQLGDRAYIAEARKVRALLDALRPDVLHTHGYRPDVLHAGVARRRGIATVTTLHGYSPAGGLSAVSELIQMRLLPEFDAVVAVSPGLVDLVTWLGVRPARIHHVPNAWRPPEEQIDRPAARQVLRLPETGAPVVGWIGRLVPVKGADVFVEGLAGLRGMPWLASIVGDGPERGRLEARARELGLADRIHFHGEVRGAGALYAAFDLFVLSSRSEGLPMVLLEAVGAGVPVVASDVGGVSRVIRSPGGGWLVPPGRPSSLAAAMGHALADPVEAARRAAVARTWLVAHFSFEPWIRAHERVYRGAAAVRVSR